MNGASVSAAGVSTANGHDVTPPSRRARRERERTIGTGTRLLPNQVDVPAEDEPADDEGTDLAVITPPPRPAPPASAFRGLRYIESRKHGGQQEDGADEDAENAEDAVSGFGAGASAFGTDASAAGTDASAAGTAADKSGAGAGVPGTGTSTPGTGSAANGRRPAAGTSSMKLGKIAKLEPPRWPTPPVFMAPERPAPSRTGATPAARARPGTPAGPSQAPAETEPAKVRKLPAEPAEPAPGHPAATEPARAQAPDVTDPAIVTTPPAGVVTPPAQPEAEEPVTADEIVAAATAAAEFDELASDPFPATPAAEPSSAGAAEPTPAAEVVLEPATEPVEPMSAPVAEVVADPVVAVVATPVAAVAGAPVAEVAGAPVAEVAGAEPGLDAVTEATEQPSTPPAAAPAPPAEAAPDPIIAALARLDAPAASATTSAPPDGPPAAPATALPPPMSRREARARASAAKQGRTSPVTPATGARSPGLPGQSPGIHDGIGGSTSTGTTTPAAATPAAGLTADIGTTSSDTTSTGTANRGTASNGTADSTPTSPPRAATPRTEPEPEAAPTRAVIRPAAATPKPAPATTPAPPGRSRARRLKAVLTLIPVLGTLITLAVLLYGAVTLTGRPVLGAVLVVAAAAVLWLIVLACVEANRAMPLPLIGADLGRTEHVRLWGTVDAAAGRLGVEEPIRIVVDGAARASLSRRPSGPELVIGLPLLLGLSEAELSAVVIHELAHDAAPGVGVHRLGERIDATIRQLGSDRRWSRRPVRLMIGGYAWAYQRLATGSNERHELRADDLAAQLTSPQVTAAAIRRTELIRDRWQILVTQYLPLSAVARRRAPLAAGLRSLLDVTAPAAPDADTDARLPFDTHLSPAQRAARLSTTDDPAALNDIPATALLAGGEDGLHALEQAVLPDGDPDADWQTIVQIAAELQAQERTGHLAWAMHEFSPHTDVTLRAVLAAVAAGEGPQIVAPLLRPGLSAQQRAASAQAKLEELLTAFVVTVLLRSGRALHEVGWPGAVRLLRRRGTAWVDWDGDEPIRSGTADPAGGAALNRWLREIDADFDAVALPTAGPPLHTLSALSDLELSLPFETRAVDLLIYRTGVLLAPIEVPTPAVRLAQQATNTLRRQSPARVAAQRIVAIAEQLGEAPQTLPGGWWIPLDTVIGGQIRARRGGVELNLRLTGGASSTTRTTNRTTARGTAMEDLARLLPTLTGDRPASSQLPND